MALPNAPRPIESQRPSLALLRGRKPDRRTEVDELRMEIHAAGLEMQAMATRITNALAADDVHSAMHFAGRLWTLGASYLAPDDEGEAA